MLTERGMQLLHAAGGDPHAVLIRAEDDDRAVLAARLRGLGPLYRSRNGSWATADFAVGRQVLADPRFVSRVLADDRYLTGLLSPAGVRFGAAACDQVPAGPFDLVADFARPALTALAADALAVPPGRREAFGQACRAMAPALDAVLCPPRLPAARGLIDAASLLRSVAPAGIAVAVGIEVTVNAVASAMLALLDAPDEWRLLCSDPGRAGRVIERTLLLDPPVRMESRVAGCDLDLHGTAISAGSEVAVHVEAAQRASGQLLPLLRDPPFAAAGPLLRIAADAILPALAARPALRRAGAVVRRLRAPVTRGIIAFPVTD